MEGCDRLPPQRHSAQLGVEADSQVSSIGISSDTAGVDGTAGLEPAESTALASAELGTPRRVPGGVALFIVPLDARQFSLAVTVHVVVELYRL